ncbi:branched-chain amino acid ABC transporter substrate-binding protein [Sporolactobacillus terrae]|uniref:Branched-chain amino acid ABC transporter substrate-binding protein n=1 Tax=Sporolactobacillus terrae TaxID=269673 RepID=A0A410D925_9BACL|nr:branched-chain amino acid ABC transporter substrate-binding protein [Sporolactobacillus terrae]QAA22586.1 branched-chain amino acid ABC transporter substrate-binding protein [Sporolactobacillus terrae]QAA25559.1 branched-chain amino acid ABC transporter substrate-binding protein [Sporolactobacillus terrae]UAK17369.1 branched-chain amino acid ABC transporter substrate-binding protein [Sporolactobacillus terrae]BBN98907.1 branched chain amino acid ABC transporter substrate-binding protein [Spo
MKLKRVVPLLAIIALLVGVLAACSPKSGGSNGKTVIEIGSQSPLSGGSATLGDAIRLGAKLAIEDRQKEFEKKGFQIKLKDLDDQGDPKKGVANAQILASDKDVLAVVGHLNSGVAIPSSEVYNKNNLAMVSPATTATVVTDRKLPTVNRICARDDFQGPAGANFAVKTLKAKKIFVIQDKTAYGSGLAEQFRDQAKKLGAEIVGYEGITVGEKDFNGVLSQAVAKKPDLIYFGGVYAEGGLIIKQARQKGFDGPIMGGDGLDSSSTVQIAGDSVKGVYLTSVAGDVSKTEKGQAFAKKYKKEFGKNVESYSAYGYDAAGVILEGLMKAIDGNDDKKPTREQVTKAIRSVQNYDGVTTKVSLDDKGDNKYAKVYIYNFAEAKYPPVQKAEISQ